MTMRAVLMISIPLVAALLGALLAATVLVSITLNEHGQRIDATRDRLVRDELIFCGVLERSPDSEQSRQIALIARRLRLPGVADEAQRTASVDRLPMRCER